MPMKKVLIAAVFGWVILISWFSNQPMKESTKQTYDFLVKLNIAEERDLILSSTEEIRSIKHLARKAAHFGLYFCLGTLMGLTLYGCLKWSGRKWFFGSWLGGSLWGILDEVHQYFIPGRSMLFKDMLIDSAGVLAAVCLMYVVISAYETIKSGKREERLFLESFY
jgi:VanZ family protein